MYGKNLKKLMFDAYKKTGIEHGNDKKMIPKEIIDLIDEALKNAVVKHPKTRMPWCDPDFDIYQRCGLVVLEAAEAMQAANKFQNENSSIPLEDIENELIQTAAIAIRVLISLYN